jgi:hypothetical protein
MERGEFENGLSSRGVSSGSVVLVTFADPDWTGAGSGDVLGAIKRVVCLMHICRPTSGRSRSRRSCIPGGAAASFEISHGELDQCQCQQIKLIGRMCFDSMTTSRQALAKKLMIFWQ